MKSKTLALLALAATGTLLMSGCASSGSSDKATITVLWQSNGDNSAMPAIAKAFEKANPDIKVNVKLLADTDLAALLSTQLPAGNGPDAFMVGIGSGSPTTLVPLAQKGLIAKVDDASWAKKLDKGTTAVGSYKGHLYGLVPTVGAIGAIYNTDALSKAGLSAPKTWDELLKFCSDAKDKGTTAFGLGLKEVWPTSLIPDALLATTIADPEQFNDQVAAGTYDYAKSAAFKSALDKEAQLDKAGCFNPSPVGTSIDTDTLPSTAKGQFLGTVTGAFHLGSLTTANPDGKFTLLPLPASNTADKNKLDLSYSNALVVNAKSKHLAAAKKFEDFFGQAASLNKMATQYQLNPTIPNSSYTSPAALGELAKLQGEGRVANVSWLAGAKMQAATFGGLQNLFLGTATPDQIAQQVQDAYNLDNGK